MTGEDAKEIAQGIVDAANHAGHSARVARSHADSALFFAVLALVGAYYAYKYLNEAQDLLQEMKEIARGARS